MYEEEKIQNTIRISTLFLLFVFHKKDTEIKDKDKRKAEKIQIDILKDKKR